MAFQASELHGAPKILIASGIGILVMAIVLSLGGFDWALKTGILSQIKINNGTDVWRQWKDIPLPVYLKATVFNITNPHELANGGKAKLVEMGPYVYREKIYKVDITINEENDTVRYHQKREYYFQPEMSNGLELDKVTIVNIPYVAVAKMAHEFTDVDYMLNKLDEMLSTKGEKFTRTETVKDLLFDGFTIQPYIDLINDPMVQSAGEVKLPPQLENGRMGIYEGKNGSDEGWIEVYRGNLNSNDFGRMASFNYKPNVSAWKGSTCNQINGTDGMLFQPFIDPNTTIIAAFAPAACRTITFKPDPDLVYHNGIPAIRFRQPEKMYQSVENNPDNWCFCTKNGTCEINGFVDLGPCFGGAPIFLSQPHLMFVDEELRNKVDGLNPDPEKHWGYVDLHPMLGVSLQAKHKMQFNMRIKQYYSMPTFENVTDHFLPIMWIEEGATLEGKTKIVLKVLTILMSGWVYAKFVLGAIGGVVLPGIAGAIIMKRRDKNVVKRLESIPPSASSKA